MKKVLVIDDSPANIKLVREALSFSDCDVVEARDGIEGIEKAGEYAPGLILMDIQMPGMDGIEAMKKIKETSGGKDVPIIALTASAMKGDRERFLDEGFDGYMSKPVSVPALIDLVEEYIGKGRAESE